MIFRKAIVMVLFFVSASFCQDTIKGTYSYTYGDSESLVEARQSCKDLALREAIESYYIFVESSTTVEDSQLKEDIIESLSAGYLKNITVVEQTEEGRTITIIIEATVVPEDVKQLVEELVMSRKDETESEDTGLEDTQADSLQKADRLSASLAAYELRMKGTESAWRQRKYDVALKQLGDIRNSVERRKPTDTTGFDWHVYQCAVTNTILITELVRMEHLESQRKRVRARALMRVILQKAEELKTRLAALEKFENLEESQLKIQKNCITRGKRTLNRVNTKRAEYRRR